MPAATTDATEKLSVTREKETNSRERRKIVSIRLKHYQLENHTI